MALAGVPPPPPPTRILQGITRRVGGRETNKPRQGPRAGASDAPPALGRRLRFVHAQLCQRRMELVTTDGALATRKVCCESPESRP